MEIPSVLGGGSHHNLSRIVLTGESTIGSYSSSQRKYNNNKEGKITVNDNLAIDPGGLFTYNSLEGGIIRMKVAQ